MSNVDPNAASVQSQQYQREVDSNVSPSTSTLQHVLDKLPTDSKERLKNLLKTLLETEDEVAQLSDSISSGKTTQDKASKLSAKIQDLEGQISGNLQTELQSAGVSAQDASMIIQGARTIVQASSAEAVMAGYSASPGSPKPPPPEGGLNGPNSMSRDITKALYAPNVAVNIQMILAKVDALLRSIISLEQKIQAEAIKGISKNAIGEAKATIDAGKQEAASLNAQATQQEFAAYADFASAGIQVACLAGSSFTTGGSEKEITQSIGTENGAIERNNDCIEDYGSTTKELSAMKPAPEEIKEADEFRSLRDTDSNGGDIGKDGLRKLKSFNNDPAKQRVRDIASIRDRAASIRHEYADPANTPDRKQVFSSFKEDDPNSPPADKFEEKVNEDTKERQERVKKLQTEQYSARTSYQQNWNTGAQIVNQCIDGTKNLLTATQTKAQAAAAATKAEYEALRSIFASLNQMLEKLSSNVGQDTQGTMQALTSSYQMQREIAQSTKQAGHQ